MDKNNKSSKKKTISQQIKEKTDKSEPKKDNTGKTMLEKFQNILYYLYQLFNFFIVGGVQTFPVETMYILGFFIYTIIISSVFLKNPFEWINEDNGGYITFFSLLGGFLILISFFFYKNRNDSFKNEEKTGTLSYFGKLATTFAFILLIVFLVYVIFNFVSYYNEFSSYVFLTMNLLIFSGIVAILYRLYKSDDSVGEPKEPAKPSWLGLIVKIFLYIPCLLLDFVDYIKYQYAITTKPIVLLLAGEIILIAMYFLIPIIIKKIITHNSKILVSDPINTSEETSLGSFQEVNYVNSINTNIDEKQFSYHYAISGWIYIDSFPPETNSNYSDYTSLLNIGNKPNILFNVLKNKLKIMLNTQGKEEQIIYETSKFNMQRWNHIVINYDGSTLDIFINNELVSSTPGIIPYNNNTSITSGTTNGIIGGLCNVIFFRDNLSRGKINWLYNSVKKLNPPII